jgi:hypothetical protein
MQASPVSREGALLCHWQLYIILKRPQAMYNRKDPNIVIIARNGVEIPIRDDELHIVRSLSVIDPFFVQTQIPEHAIGLPMGRIEALWRYSPRRIL